MLARQEGGLIEVATLSAHGDGGIQVKLEVTGRTNELFKLLYIFEFGVAVEQ